jgi:hypothetical protein
MHSTLRRNRRLRLTAGIGFALLLMTTAVDAGERADDANGIEEPASVLPEADLDLDVNLDLDVDLGRSYDGFGLRLNLGMLQDAAEADQGERGDSTGTDPRDFTSKLMPYFLYTKLENEVEVKQMNLFGMHAFTTRFAMTYDLPVAKEIDYSDLDAFELGTGGIPPGSGFGAVPGDGVPFSDLDSDGDVVGMGDLNLRFFLRPEELEWSFDDGNSMGKKKGISVMPVMEMLFPTATDDALGGGAMILSPGVTIVTDIPGEAPFGLGFFAMMNFIDFDIFKDNNRESTTRYRGRWFWMQPLSKPGPSLFDGLYVLTEFQPVYDFMESDFDFWIGPEFGKAFDWGAVYAKPGWGIDTEAEDRDFTLEIGFRYFF